MKDLSFFKKLKLLFDYLRIVKQKKIAILDKKNTVQLRLDKAKRFYTVCNCDKDVEKYGKNLAEKYIKEHINMCEKIFINSNLIEFVGVWDITQIDETNYLIVFGFKGFRTERLFRNTIIFSSLLLGSGIYFFLNFL